MSEQSQEQQQEQQQPQEQPQPEQTPEQPQQPEQPQPEQAPEQEGEKKTVVYSGPAGQVNLDVGEPLEPGKSYEVSAELADRLVASSGWWSESGESA